jgi:hypothetical protein
MHYHLPRFAIYELAVIVLAMLVYSILSTLTTKHNDEDPDYNCLRTFLRSEAEEEPDRGPENLSKEYAEFADMHY